MLSVESEHGNVPRIGLMERIEGDDPSTDGIESPGSSEYTHLFVI
jgi:hypothetical protein